MIIIGGGASGLMCAAMMEGKNVLLLEGSGEFGKKIAISGGGRCNVTNTVVDPTFFKGDPLFIERVLNAFTSRELVSWIEQKGLTLTLRPNGCYFCPLKASQMVDLLVKEVALKCTMVKNEFVEELEKSGDLYEVRTQNGSYCSQNVVLATGGISYPLVGANDSGIQMALSLGHTLKSLLPALVGWTLQKDQFWMKELSGISLPVTLSMWKKTLQGDLLFAHKGVSGPVVLNGSLYWEKGAIEADFLPHVTVEECVQKGGNKFVSSIFPLPKRFIEGFMSSLQLPDAPYKSYTQDHKDHLATLKKYRFSPAGNFGYSKAEVTKGGICTEEIDPLTMESQISKGLFLLGEMVDVTGEVGGYNFQWAFSSAHVAAKELNKR